MNKTFVVNIMKMPYDVYVGRPGKIIIAEQILDKSKYHFGNPFSHSIEKSRYAGHLIKVETREQAIQAYEDWLSGDKYLDLEPERRTWILLHIPQLKGKILGCFCHPQPCHGHILAKLAEKY